MTNETTQTWFETDIQPHLGNLALYARRAFPGLEADDVVQETMLLLLEAHRRRPVPAEPAFLYRCTRNAAITMLRRDSRWYALRRQALETVDGTRP